MKVLYFDCVSGISGDMTLGALLDMDIDAQLFKAELDKLKVDGYTLIIEKKTKNGIVCTDVDVRLDGWHKEQHSSNTHHSHHVGEGHTHSHEAHCHEIHSHEIHSHEIHSHDARNLKDIETIIDNSGITRRAKDLSKEVFREIAAAEAKVHGKNIHDVHFHEVGAVDSIVDIVGTAICIDMLGVEKVFASKLHDGHGFIECQHGRIPVPVPAVMEILSGSGIPLVQTDVPTELITPTGMAIIKCLSSGFGVMPQMHIDKVGYGSGKRETGGFNALRIIMGTM